MYWRTKSKRRETKDKAKTKWLLQASFGVYLRQFLVCSPNFMPYCSERLLIVRQTPSARPPAQVAVPALRGVLARLAELFRQGDVSLDYMVDRFGWQAHSARAAVIRTSSVEDHVRDLIEAGILTPVE
jgi:hypothetical protein